LPDDVLGPRQHGRPLGSIGNPIVLVREALKKCPDQRPSPSVPTLMFIQDPGMRESIRLDIDAASSALNNREWKAATVLAGSATEAILLDQITSGHSEADREIARKQVETSRTPKGSISRDAAKWSFVDLIDIAAHLKIVKEDTQKQCHLARNYRNTIHPGRLRRGEVCDRGSALGALAACEMVIRDRESAIPPAI